jgi:hypothetical protein
MSSFSRFAALNTLSPRRFVALATVAAFALIVGLMSINVFAEAPLNNDVCTTSSTRVAFEKDRGVIQVFSDFSSTNPNGMLITEIALSSVPSVTDAQKASGENVWLVSKDSEYASGWHVNLYWNNNYYGATVTSPSLSDNTGALCAL